MIKGKLKRLKRAEEKRILKEHEGLYAQIVRENYPKEEKRASVWVPVLSSVAAVFVCLFGAFAAFNIGRVVGSDKGNPPSNMGGVQSSESGVEGDNPVPPTVSEAKISDVSDALTCSSLQNGLKFKHITSVSTAGEQDCFEMELDTIHTLDILVKINPEYAVSESYLPSGNVLSTVTSADFRVEYSFTKRKIEDYYQFNSKAVVSTDSEVYYIRYDYSSSSSECELLALIEACIKPI